MLLWYYDVLNSVFSLYNSLSHRWGQAIHTRLKLCYRDTCVFWNEFVYGIGSNYRILFDLPVFIYLCFPSKKYVNISDRNTLAAPKSIPRFIGFLWGKIKKMYSSFICSIVLLKTSSNQTNTFEFRSGLMVRGPRFYRR